MRRRLVVEYEGNDTLAITLVESIVKEIHESPGGKLRTLSNDENEVSFHLDVIAGLQQGQ